MADLHSAKPRAALLRQAAKKVGLNLTFTSSRELDEEKALTAFLQHDLVLFDGLSAEVATQSFAKYQALIAMRKVTRFGSLRDVGMPGLRKNIAVDTISALSRYYTNGGRYNFENMMAYIAAEIFNLDVAYHPARKVPKAGLYHPDFPAGVTADAEKFFLWLSSYGSVAAKKQEASVSKQPVIAIAMHRSGLDIEQTQLADSLIKQAQYQGAKALGFFYEGENKQKKYTDLLQDKGTTRIDTIINLRMIHYVKKRRRELDLLNVPVIQGMVYRQGDQAAFERALAGVSATMTPYFLVMPETAGLIDSTIVAAIDQHSKQQQVIDYQIESVVRRAIGQARLRHLPNHKKRLATLIWNYPPGEKNVGAAFLNVPESLHRITRALRHGGYRISEKQEQFYIDKVARLLKPFYRTDQLDTLLDGLLADGLADYLPLDVYQRWFTALPENVQQSIVDRWGEPLNNTMVRDHNGEPAFIIPRMQLGNMIVLPQPPRADNAQDSAALYHSMTAPINHYYLAVYLYIRQQWGADAIVHLGTHGSQEWLPGKERALANFDPPHLAVGDLPVVYPYIMDNVGEAMQAKRRGRALTISHLTPGFARAELYGDFAQFAQLYNDWFALDQGETKQRTQQQLLDLVEMLNINEDIAWTAEQIAERPLAFFSQAQDFLQEMAQEAQPLGLHTFGDTPIDVHLVTTIAQMLGEDFTQRSAVFEQKHKLAVDVPEARQSGELDRLNVTRVDQLDGFKLLWLTLMERGLIKPAPIESLLQSKKKSLPPVKDSELARYLDRAAGYYRDFHGQREMQNFLAALQGRYIPTGTGGDPIRNPEAIVTGKNLIGFNPARVPTKAAYATGRRMVEQTIANYYREHSQYPDKLAFSLWSLETMRHHGALEAQVLAAMGIKPVWDKNGAVTGTEVIPYAQLKRPRVDVVVSATGLYRDAFPSVLLLLAKGIKELASLKEKGNSIYAHSRKLKKHLLAAGKTEADAEYLSSVRVFSNESGAYGTGLAGTTLASGSWEKESKLSTLYLARMGYAFGADEKRWSEKVEGFNLYEKTLSGTDAVVFSRSTNLYGMLTRDDPFQYFGGISLAVRNIDGKSPDMIVANLRDINNSKMETLKRFMAREMRSRAFHPRWISEMQKEGYSGAVQILDRLNNFWGWAVVDPNAVTNAQWQEWFEIYINDKYDLDMRAWYEQHNPHNLAQMIERLLEAERKDYWQTDKATLRTLVETYREVSSRYDVVSDNQVFKAYWEQKLEVLSPGFGLGLANAPASSGEVADTAMASANQPVSGQRLEKQTPPLALRRRDWTWLWLLLICALPLGLGILRQAYTPRFALTF